MNEKHPFLPEEMMNKKEQFSQDGFAENMKTIENWLLSDGWTVRKRSEERAILAEDQSGTKVVLFRTAGRPDTLVIRSDYGLSDGDIRRLKELGSKKMEDVLWKVRFEVIRFGVGFLLNEDLSGFGVVAKFYLEDMRRNEFARALLRVQNSIVCISMILQKEFGERGPMRVFIGPDEVIH